MNCIPNILVGQECRQQTLKMIREGYSSLTIIFSIESESSALAV
ncbi:hypothetical protein [Zooshikella harenae]|nr:hypothetical protein [Zooshikella harenae]